MATQKASIIGRIGIRVHPVANGFRQEAQAELDKVQAQLDAVKVGIELGAHNLAQETRDAVRDARRAAGSVKVDLRIDEGDGLSRLESKVRQAERDLRINFGLNTEQATRELKKVRENWDGDDIEFDVLVASLKARLELARVARARNVTLFVTVSKRSMATAAATIAALSGARLIGDQLDRLWQRIQDLDKSIPMLSALASAFLGVAAAVGSGFSNLSAMVASLAQIFPVFLALPGLAGGFAFGLGAAYAVLKDFNDVLPEVGDRFSALQDSMSARFWKVAEEPIRNMIDNLFPQLEKGLLHTADGLGVFFAAFSRGLDNRLDGYLVPMFKNLQESMTIASQGADALAGAITTLGRTGSSYLPRLADWFRRNVINFDRWLEESYNSGALQGWIDRGIERMHQLWAATRDLGVIIYTLGIEAERAGGAGLQQFAQSMADVRDVVESPSFLNSYRQFISASHGFFEDINTGIGGRFGAFMHTFVDQMTTAFDNLGLSIGNFLGSLYDMLGSNAITKGWDALTTGLATGLDGFSKNMEDIGLGIGAFQQIVGTMAANFLPILGTVFATLGRILHDNGPQIKQVIETMAQAFSDLVDDLAPVVERWFPLLVSALQAIAPYAGELLILAAGLKALKLAASGMGVLKGAAASIGSLTRALAGGTAAGASGAGAGLTGWLANLRAIPAALGPKLKAIFEPISRFVKSPGVLRVAGVIGAIGLAIKGMWDNSAAFRTGARNLFSSLMGLASTLENMFGNSLYGVEDTFQFFRDFWDFLAEFASWLKSGLNVTLGKLGDVFGNTMDQVSILINALNDFLNGRSVDWSGFDWKKLLGLEEVSTSNPVGDLAKTLGEISTKGPALGATAAALKAIARADITPVSGTMKEAALRAGELRAAVEKGAASFFDLTEDVDNADVSLRGWMETLRSQIDARATWQSNLDKLRDLGLSDAAYEALAGLEEGGALRVQELLDEGTSGVEEFNALIADGLGQTGKYATAALGDLPASVRAAIDGMNKAAATTSIDVGAWEGMGSDAASGFIKGLSSGQDGAGKTATTVALAARKGMTSALDINSPSRVTHQIGVWAAQGFIDGLNSLLTGTHGAAVGLANELLRGLKGSSGYNAGRALGMGVRKGLYSYNNDGTGKAVGDRIISGIKGASGYSAGRDIAQSLREGLYSYNNDGTGRRVGNDAVSGMKGASGYSAGRGLARSLRDGMYSYPNSGTGRAVANAAASGMRGVSTYNSGYAMGKDFAKGMEASIRVVKKAANNVVSSARKYFGNSPAEEGPLSGSGWVDKSGIAMGEDFAAGMLASIPKVRMAALAMADAASAASDANMTGFNAAITTDNQHVISLANTPVTMMVDSRPMQAYIREGVDSGMEQEGRTLKYARSWKA